MVRWAYIYVFVSDDDISKTIDILNKNGTKGWEFTGHTEDIGHGIRYLMKKPW